MPNVKIFVDEERYAATQARLTALLTDLRVALCTDLSVDSTACQMAVIPVRGLPDQPLVNVELQLISRPDRRREMVTEVAAKLRDRIGDVMGQPVAVRITMLEPATYVTLK